MAAAASRAWRLLDTGAARGSMNMAIDDALMDSVRHGGAPVLRLYRWDPACLSLGRNQPAHGFYDLRVLEEAEVDVVRRPTGGRAVLHDDELTYSVICGDRDIGPPRAAYAKINEVLVKGLAALGAPAAIQAASGAPAPVPSTVPCFADPVEGEVLADGRKLIGSAQVRRDGVLLQHGSLPFRPGHASLRLADMSWLAGGGTPAYLETVLGHLPPWEDVARALATAWATEIAPAEPARLSADERTAAEALEPVYASADWTWRR